MKLILTSCIRFIEIWNSLRFFIIRFADYKRKLPQVTINRIQCVKISFIPYITQNKHVITYNAKQMRYNADM
jgi:hypothetical protein